MGEKVYCDECIYLQNRDIKVNGNITGKRYYCPVLNKWYAIGTTKKEVGFMCCDCGKRKGGQNETEQNPL